MTQRLILVRHGLTLWNHEFRYQGHTDIRLSPEGIKQAYALKERIKNENLSAIYCSDLKRSLETAQIIAEPHQLKVQINPLLKEINFGVWEGLTFQDIQMEYPEQLRIWLESPHLLEIEKGETFAALRDRAMQALQEILAKHPAENIAVVSHGGTIAALICGLLNESLTNMWQYKQKNAAVNILILKKEKIEIEFLNDISHLI